MTLFNNKYRIESARLKGYDYSSPGRYFVTICAGGMIECFGDVVNHEMKRNDVGEIAHQLWMAILNQHNNVKIDEFIIMPNHVHGIIILCENDYGRDAIIRVSTNGANVHDGDVSNRVSTNGANVHDGDGDAINHVSTGGITKIKNPMLTPQSLSYIIRQYKARVSFETHKIYPEFRWQPRFYDHIIRDERGLIAIREYIHNNPLQWEYDRNDPSG
jgi:REP element-mobilizing transposase RayT